MVTRHRWRACMFGSPRLPGVAGTHVTPLEGGSPVGGHGDVFSGGSPWTVTGHLPDLPCFARFLLVHPLSTCYIYTRYADVTPRPPGVMGMLLTRTSLHRTIVLIRCPLWFGEGVL